MQTNNAPLAFLPFGSFSAICYLSDENLFAMEREEDSV